MIDPPKTASVHINMAEISKHLDCGDLSALVALWVLEQKLNNNSPVYIVTLETEDWTHTVCEVKGLGTLDGKNNLYIPDYFYHKEPTHELLIHAAKPLFSWYSVQKKSTTIKQWYNYDPSKIIKTNLLLFGDYTSFSTKMELM